METVNVEVPGIPAEIVTLAEGVKDAVGPLVETGETVAAKFTVPLKLSMLVKVMVEVPDEPWRNVREDGFDMIEKSGVGGRACTLKVPTMLRRCIEQ